jgi:SGNH hydrolase-like domain, acetyltransferase AlgX
MLPNSFTSISEATRRRIGLATALAAGVLLALCVLEAVLRLLPVRDGLFVGDPDPEWSGYHFVPHTHFTHSDDWNLENVRHGVTNNMGYVAPFDYIPGETGIVVVGDSYVESTMNRYEDSMQSQLATQLTGSEPVLNFGYSGASLSDYLGMTALVHRRFTIDWLVVVIVPGDFVEGYVPERQFFHWAPDRVPPVQQVPRYTKSGVIKKTVRTLAVFRYITGQLGVTYQSLFGYAQSKVRSGCPTAKLESGDEELIQAVIHSFPSAAGIPPSKIILVFDPDIHPLNTTPLRGSRSACTTRDSLARARLASSAAEYGMHVLDMRTTFATYSSTTHEPVDYPDTHWNATGNRLVAEKVAEVIGRAHTAIGAAPAAKVDLRSAGIPH